jgi:hypothetical protein
MRDRRVRLAFVILILGFPPLMLRMAGTAFDRDSARVLLGVESILACGLVVVARNRRDLLAGPATPTNPIPGYPRYQSLRAPVLVAGSRRRPS